MRHLKLIKARVKDTEVEQDLRGLSNEPCFMYAHPIAVLSITGLHTVNLSDQEFRSFSTNTSQPVTHLVALRSNPTGNKADAVRLFLKALQCFKQEREVAAVALWESMPMREYMMDAFRRTPGLLKIDDVIAQTFGHELLKEHHLTIATASMLHLKQAGFSTLAAYGENESITRDRCIEILTAEVEVALNQTSVSDERKAA